MTIVKKYWTALPSLYNLLKKNKIDYYLIIKSNTYPLHLQHVYNLGFSTVGIKNDGHSMNPCPSKSYNKLNTLNSFSTPEPVCPSKSSGPLAQPVVSDLFFNIAKYSLHFGLITYYTTCCGGSITNNNIL